MHPMVEMDLVKAIYRDRLQTAERQLELGLITVEEYEAIEDEALAQLEREEAGTWPT